MKHTFKVSLERKTPLLPPASGEFLRDQIAPVREQCETLLTCPKCEGEKEITIRREGPTGYFVFRDTCDYCGGVGCVPKFKAAV